MKVLNKLNKVGHLLAFSNREEVSDNFSFFLPVEGLAQFEALNKVVDGFRAVSEDYEKDYEFKTYSVADIGRVREVFPQVDEDRLLRLDLESLLDDRPELHTGFANLLVSRQAGGRSRFPSLVTGGLATEDNFFDREDELKDIWDRLDQGKNLLLRAPRRFGKSSLAMRLFRQPRESWRVCYVDLEGGDSGEDFVLSILKGLTGREEWADCLPENLAKCRIWEKNEVQRHDLLRGNRDKIKDAWQASAEELFRRMDAGPGRFLLILDEFSFLLEDMIGSDGQQIEQVRDFMSWFSNVRKGSEKLTFLLTGSEHLPNFLDSFGLSGNLGDLENVHLQPFGLEKSREFIFLALTGLDIAPTPGDIKRILELMGKPIPYFLQLFLDLLAMECRQAGTLSGSGIGDVYFQKLLGPEAKRYFEFLERQLERYQRRGPLARTGAEAILDNLAVKDSMDLQDLENVWRMAGGQGKFEAVLALLKDDFYIQETDGRVSLAARMIKDWWLSQRLPDLSEHAARERKPS